MRHRLGLVGWIVLALGAVPRAQEGDLAALAVRQKLRALTGELARCGDPALVERMRALLAALGDEPEDLERLAEGWRAKLASDEPGPALRPALASRLQPVLETLVEQLAREEEPRRAALARCILALDAYEPAANAALGRVRGPDGDWLTAEELAWDQGARAVARAQREAARLDFDFERGTSANPALRQAAGQARTVRAEGIELHASLEYELLERVLRQALRAAAFSRAVLGSDARTKPVPHCFVLLATDEQFRTAEEEARATLGPDAPEPAAGVRLDSFFDPRGWETVRWIGAAQVSALMLWRLQADWIARDAQPCLRVGHVNGVCLGLLGASLPQLAWQELGEPDAQQRSSAAADGELARRLRWRVARRSLWGCRSWMVQEVRGGRAPSWSRAMLDQDGKIRDAPLLMTTLVCEMLLQEGKLPALLEATRGARAPVAAIEDALGETLPALEARWRRWLDPERARGLRQELEAEVPAAEGFAGALRALNQARANALRGQDPEIPLVGLDPDLSRAAERHARYLTRNPAQKGAWPAMHEEQPDKPGFSLEGALVASRALIAEAGDPVAAIQAWLGTFHHRLPLLDPGLVGVGLGASEDVFVLDARSLVLAPWKDHVVVWPLPGAVGVPRALVPEQPNPVPGADMGTLGQPVTVQLFFPDEQEVVTLALELFVGLGTAGERVECHALSPHAPQGLEHVPPNAFGLIPQRVLLARTLYTARARWLDRERTWSFTTGE